MAKKIRWTEFPHSDPKFDYAGTKLAKAWKKLHAGDLEPFPDEARVAALLKKNPKLGKAAQAGEIAEALAEAWRAFHRGDFQNAYEAGSALGPLGASVAIKAAGIHATHLLDDANSHYLLAFALGRYSQSISIAKALTQGLAGKVRDSLQRTLELAPDHAEAHTALGLYHAEVVSKVGGLIAGLTYGAKPAIGESLLKRAIELTPDSPIAHIEYGNGLMLLFGSKKEDQTAGEYEKAARCKPLDAMEKLDAEYAASQIED